METTKHVIVGTAGHIDHGKSTLVEALTGTNPDRLEEEKRRGITIDLGFAFLDLGDVRTSPRSRNANPRSMVIPRRFSSSRRSGLVPVSASTSVDLPWSMWPAVPTITCLVVSISRIRCDGRC